jgi:hypothetical protein
MEMPFPYPFSSFFSEAIEILAELVNADAGGETTPDFERAKIKALDYLRRINFQKEPPR